MSAHHLENEDITPEDAKESHGLYQKPLIELFDTKKVNIEHLKKNKHVTYRIYLVPAHLAVIFFHSTKMESSSYRSRLIKYFA